MHIYALTIVKNLVITMNKKLSQLGLAIFIAIIFISSYVSLTNYNSQQATTTTVPQTAVAQGVVQARLTGYGGPMYFLINSKNTTIVSESSNVIISNLTVLEVNNSVLDFYQTGRNISVAPENMSAFQVYSFIKGKLNQTLTNDTAAYATAYLELPSLINLTVGTQKVQVAVPSSYLNQSVPLAMTYPTGSDVRLKILTDITANGTVYGQMNLVVLT
jgi:hypothetical protein